MKKTGRDALVLRMPPQTFVPNIFDVKASDYRAATVTVLHGGSVASAGLLPIVR